MSLFQPFSELVVGGTKKLLLSSLLFLMDCGLQLGRINGRSKGPLGESLNKVWLIQLFRGMVSKPLQHLSQIMQDAGVSLVLSHVDPNSHPLPVGSAAFLPDLWFGGVNQGSLEEPDV